jgi:hypothetical protein
MMEESQNTMSSVNKKQKPRNNNKKLKEEGTKEEGTKVEVSEIEEKVTQKVKNTRKKKVTNVEAQHTEAQHTEAQHTEAQHTEAQHTEAQHTEAQHTEAQHTEAQQQQDEDNDEDKKKKLHKKRGRKPMGGKIVVTSIISDNDVVSEPNIILHLKCGKNDLEKKTDMLMMKYDPNIENVENYQFDKNKGSELNFFVISDNTTQVPTTKSTTTTTTTQQQQQAPPQQKQQPQSNVSSSLGESSSSSFEGETSENKLIWKKIQKLSINLHNNNINDKKSACFWCTCDFDNPPIYIPKYELNDSYHCYGCFCSPECATASLFKESIDTSTKFERYHLINHIYCKIYNYTKNVKPAPEPYYTLNKYYGNLTIQEYRKLLKNDRLILIVDKPFTRSLPELHEDNDDFILNNKTIPTISNKYKMKAKPSKSTLLSENFNMTSK